MTKQKKKIPDPPDILHGIIIPAEATLKRYGLSRYDWIVIMNRQNWVCAICHQKPGKGRLAIDHEHVKGWKKMKPDQRKLYVRGLCCWFDNHYRLARGATVENLRSAADYLESYEIRKKQPIKDGV